MLSRTSGWIAPLFLLLAAQAISAAERGGLWLQNDWPAAKAEARAKGKPIFVVFR